ncbi:MAG: DUF1989 domain-containing protein [Bryobacteraceae bacterium]
MHEIPGELLWEESIDPGGTWSHVLKRGTTLRLTDSAGGVNVGALFYNADNPTERYNMPDTLKAQQIAKLTDGFVLYSDMGRVLAPSSRTPPAGTMPSADARMRPSCAPGMVTRPTRRIATAATRMPEGFLVELPVRTGTFDLRPTLTSSAKFCRFSRRLALRVGLERWGLRRPSR